MLKLINTEPIWLILRKSDGTSSDFLLDIGEWNVERIPNPAGYDAPWLKIMDIDEKKLVVWWVVPAQHSLAIIPDQYQLNSFAEYSQLTK